MNKISARIIALLLCASTSAVVFSACAKDDGPKKTVDPTGTKENNTKEPTFEIHPSMMGRSSPYFRLTTAATRRKTSTTPT